MGMLDRQRAERAKDAGDFQMATTIIMPSSSAIVSQSIGAKGLVEAERRRRDHRRAAEKGDAGAVERRPGMRPIATPP